jgi:hypothetical protein
LKHIRVVLAAVVLTAIPGLALAASRTQVHIYEPFNSAGQRVGHVAQTISGSCLGNSDASRRGDAWRCEAQQGFGVFILDPCFSSDKAKHFVLCPATGPWSNKVIKLKLTRQLGHGPPGNANPTHGLPWALITVENWRCRLNTGATTFSHGKRLNYACKGTTKKLWGAPERRSEPWKIYVAGKHPRRFHTKTGIKAAWF